MDTFWAIFEKEKKILISLLPNTSFSLWHFFSKKVRMVTKATVMLLHKTPSREDRPTYTPPKNDIFESKYCFYLLDVVI